jgi:UDP-N-acetylglucosamine--N-acetylmuramyl-(pentapeptide) pyrophosphoryl-undecaprenol N-acetylglucosamine transferase
VTEAYRAARVNVELATFFTDLPERVTNSHLVIGRAGASTVAELAVLGRPAILVPLPGSLDQDQRANALVMERGGGAWVADQATLSPQSLATQIHDLFLAPDRLAAAAQAAQSVGVADAVERLADLVEQTAKGQS